MFAGNVHTIYAAKFQHTITHQHVLLRRETEILLMEHR